MKKTKKEKRRLFLIVTIFFVLSSFLFFNLYKDLKQTYQNKQKKLELTEKYKSLLDEEKKLESELIKMSEPDYVARYAKEKYMFSGPNETIIRMD